MGLHRIERKRDERAFLGVRIIGFDELDQLELPHHDEAVLAAFRPLPPDRQNRWGGAKLMRGAFDWTGCAARRQRSSSKSPGVSCPGVSARSTSLLDFEHVLRKLLGLVQVLFLYGSFLRDRHRVDGGLLCDRLLLFVSSSSRSSSLTSASSSISAPAGAATPNRVVSSSSSWSLRARRSRHASAGRAPPRPLVDPARPFQSAISRNATTGFLSSSRSSTEGHRKLFSRARCAASRTSSNRFGTLNHAIFDGNTRHVSRPLHRRLNRSIYGACRQPATAPVLTIRLLDPWPRRAPYAGGISWPDGRVVMQRTQSSYSGSISASGLQGLCPLKQTLSSPVYRLCHRLPTAPSV